MRRFLLALTFIMLLGSAWLALTVGKINGPPAMPDSPVRNIIFAHVPSSVCALLCFGVLLICAIGYIATSKEIWDQIAEATAEVGALFAIVMNATGSIFSRAEWNIWWTASPRLVSAAILLFLYLVYLILRSSLPGSKKRRARVAAVFAIIAFLDVPLVIISARFLPDIHRANFSFDLSWQRAAFFLGMASTVMLAAMLIWIRTDVIKLKSKLQELD